MRTIQISFGTIFTFLLGSWLAVAMLTRVASGQPQQQKSGMAFIDLQRLVDESKTLREMATTWREELTRAQDDISSMVAQYRRRSHSIRETKYPLTKEQEGQAREYLNSLEIRIEKRQDHVRQILKSIEDVVEGPARRLIMEAVAKVAQEKGYAIVVSRKVLLYGLETHDVTDEVAKEVDNLASKSPGDKIRSEIK